MLAVGKTSVLLFRSEVKHLELSGNQIGSHYVPVHDSIIVKILQSQDDTSCVEAGPGLTEHVRVDMHHEIPARRVLHHEAHVRVSLGERDVSEPRDWLFQHSCGRELV